MASAVNSLLGSTTSADPASQNTNAAASAATSATGNEQMFLQLLVSQLKNQDPLNPVDGTQFVSQLSQFSQLEQLIAIRGDLDKNSGANPSSSGTPPTGAPASGTPSTGTPSTGTTN